MVEDDKIRVSKEFKRIVDYVRGKSMLMKGKTLSSAQITRVIAKNIDKERLYENEFS